MTALIASRRLRQARKLLANHERDPGFREVVFRHNIAGMRLCGIFAIGVVFAFLIGSVVEGKEIIAVPSDSYSARQVALVDKALIAVIGALLLIASKLRFGFRGGRAIVAIALVVIVVAIVLDDAARHDPEFAPIYIIVTLVTGVGAMPFRPVQTVLLSAAAIVGYVSTLTFIGPLVGLERLEIPEGHLLILVLVGLVLGGVSLFLYNLRFHQYRLERNMRLVKERVERQAVALSKRNKFIRQVFGRYMSDEVVQKLLETPSGLHIGGHKTRVTILMSDIRGFTSLSEQLEAEDVVRLLNTYLKKMTEVIEAFGGTIDEFVGDGIMVLFGAPYSQGDDAFRAVACAVAMQRAVDEVNADNTQQGLPSIETGIGVHTGDAVVGNIGSEVRAKYGVVGATANLTARIESYSVGGQVLISEATLESAEGPIDVSNPQLVEPKGASSALKIFRVERVGFPYDLEVPRRTDHLVTVHPEPIVEFSILEEKFVGRTVHAGTLAAVSADFADLRSNVSLPTFSNLKVNIFSDAGEPIEGDVYAKVVSEGVANHTSRLRFTSLSPESRTFLERCVQNSSG